LLLLLPPVTMTALLLLLPSVMLGTWGTATTETQQVISTPRLISFAGRS
jgi:hypothetical protein